METEAAEEATIVTATTDQKEAIALQKEARTTLNLKPTAIRLQVLPAKTKATIEPVTVMTTRLADTSAEEVIAPAVIPAAVLVPLDARKGFADPIQTKPFYGLTPNTGTYD